MALPRIPAFFFDRAHLADLAGGSAAAYRAAAPFPHAVFDDFLPREIADLLAIEFPGPDAPAWVSRDFDATTQTKKLGMSDETGYGPLTRLVMGQLIGHTFLAFLEALTGVPGLITDPSHNECGLHSTGRGGKLAVHTDLNRHPIKGRLHQHLNVLYYASPGWDESWGGHLELWDDKVRRAVQRILPRFNRLVVFETGARSFHGHPQPLTCPANRRRNSLALYYYTLERSEHAGGLQDDVNWVATQPDELRIVRGRQVRRFVRAVTPPFLLDMYRKVKRKTPR